LPLRIPLFCNQFLKQNSLTLNEFLLVGAASTLVFFAVEIEKMITGRKKENREPEIAL
jgi:hypothetical protein